VVSIVCTTQRIPAAAQQATADNELLRPTCLVRHDSLNG